MISLKQNELDKYMESKVEVHNATLRKTLLSLTVFSSFIGASVAFVFSSVNPSLATGFLAYHFLSLAGAAVIRLTSLSNSYKLFYSGLIAGGFAYAHLVAELMALEGSVYLFPKMAVSMYFAIYIISSMLWLTANFRLFCTLFFFNILNGFIAASPIVGVDYFVVLTLYIIPTFVGTIYYFERQKFFKSFNTESFLSTRKMIPDQVYRNNGNIDEDSSVKDCFFISSDWRSYQKLSEKLSPKEITTHLSNYYQEVEILLNNYFQETGFFSDWIADELFVSIPTPKESLAANASKIIQFCQDVDKMIARLFKESIDLKVDFGVSYGPAITGFIGPSSHRKMTSLGKVPGIARRLQTYGKRLRTTNGDHCYLISNDNTIAGFAQFNLDKQCIVSEEATVRDLGDTTLTCILVDKLNAKKKHDALSFKDSA